MIASLLFAVALAADEPQPQQASPEMNAAAAYVQSLFLPIIFTACKAHDASKAAAYDNALDTWNKANKNVVKTGEEITRKQAKASGMEMDAMTRMSVDELKQDLASKTPEELTQGCANTLQQAWVESQHPRGR